MPQLYKYRAHYLPGSDYQSNLTGPAAEFDASDCDRTLTTDDIWEMITDNDQCLWCYVWQGREDPSVVQTYLTEARLTAKAI